MEEIVQMAAAKSSVLKIEVTQGPELAPWEIAARKERLRRVLESVFRRRSAEIGGAA